MTSEFLEQKYLYGGEICSLGSIITDLQRIAPNQKCVDMYIVGLLSNQKPIK